jgi:hypothetical protein
MIYLDSPHTCNIIECVCVCVCVCERGIDETWQIPLNKAPNKGGKKEQATLPQEIMS